MGRLAEGWKSLLKRWKILTGKPTASGELAVERANDGGKECGRRQRRRVVFVPLRRSFSQAGEETERTSTEGRSREHEGGQSKSEEKTKLSAVNLLVLLPRLAKYSSSHSSYKLHRVRKKKNTVVHAQFRQFKHRSAV
jgi:hypothetical protein